jgi:hypothetical protein
MRGISRVAEDLLASQEGLCSMELVGWWVVHMKCLYSFNVCQKLLAEYFDVRRTASQTTPNSALMKTTPENDFQITYKGR